MDDIASWIATIATVTAAIMTAANLGARITGFGFCVFTLASLAWCVTALRSGQNSLLVTNGLLLLVNMAGIWRWLGREATYDTGRTRAARRSRDLPVPSLFPAGAAIGSPVCDKEGEAVGRIVDLVLRCDTQALGYAVISRGGVAGVGEELFGLEPKLLKFGPDRIECMVTAEDLSRCPRLSPGNWPARLPDTGESR